MVKYWGKLENNIGGKPSDTRSHMYPPEKIKEELERTARIPYSRGDLAHCVSARLNTPLTEVFPNIDELIESGKLQCDPQDLRYTVRRE